jgi:homopolymeric O-antigen transport system ATP-binding protein
MLPMIKVRGLGKLYRLGERQGYTSFRETIISAIQSPFRRLSSRDKLTDENPGAHIWALRNISFEVMPGDVLGIVGRNGGGKSTLLKILSRITHPTEGRVELYGRVGSLLEVGTGFHPELTGRENIFLNGAILGMKRAEILKKFDEIVDFSGIENFLDTPVKRYSSGMYVRLAFAVAAHLEPEILLVDEVLAVGDIEFQNKCLGKMGEIARGGRTVLFVSHNMLAVEALCKSAIFLEAGGVRMAGKPMNVVSEYTKSVTSAGAMFADLSSHSGRRPEAMALMTEVSVISNGPDPSVIRMGDDIQIVVKFKSPKAIRPCCGFTIKTDRGARIFNISDRYSNQLAGVDSTASGTLTCSISSLPLMPGRYLVDLWLEDFALPTRFSDMVADACWFEVAPANLLGSGKLPPSTEGPIFLNGDWSLRGETDSVWSDGVAKYSDLAGA